MDRKWRGLYRSNFSISELLVRRRCGGEYGVVPVGSSPFFSLRLSSFHQNIHCTVCELKEKNMCHGAGNGDRSMTL